MYITKIIPTPENHTVEIPEEFYGKEISIEIINVKQRDTKSLNKENSTDFRSMEERNNDARKFFITNSVDFSKIEKFTREDLYN